MSLTIRGEKEIKAKNAAGIKTMYSLFFQREEGFGKFTQKRRKK